jgi:hypothetical protein
MADEFRFGLGTIIADMSYEEFVKAKTLKCAMCGKPSIYLVEDLPVGARGFCTEKHYAEFAGLPFNGEGYYQLEKMKT